MVRYFLREISETDNSEIARIIRSVLVEFGADRPGFAWQDPELDDMAQAYDREGYRYFVAVMDGAVVGGAGIAPFECDLPQTCELQKMYLLPRARGKGVGWALLQQALQRAFALGYRQCYLETLSGLTGATTLYERNGFVALGNPMGQSGHTGCNLWYMRELGG